eukprot:scaffold5688_cov18-Tisochrysis_lutea.AAC.1
MAGKQGGTQASSFTCVSSHAWHTQRNFVSSPGLPACLTHTHTERRGGEREGESNVAVFEHTQIPKVVSQLNTVVTPLCCTSRKDLSKLLACAPGTQGDVAALEQSLHERDGHLTAALEQLAQLKGQLARRESALAQAGALVGWVGRDRSDCVRVRVCVCAPRGAFPTPSRLSRPLSCAAKQRQKRAWLAIVCELLEHPASIPVMQYPRASWACF